MDDFRDDRGKLKGDDSKRQSHFNSVSNRVLIGVILVLAGLLLIIRNTGIIPDFINNVIFSWPMLLSLIHI